MTFCNNDDTKSESLDLEDCSLLVTSRFAQDFWRHGILPQNEISGERISLTFREISPHFMNSTILLGDSNTAKVAFGTGSGTLGAWVPGKRVKVGHIEALPDAVDIGPYRNIVIHTGINSINSRFQPRSDAYLIHVLEKKCKDYMTVYPRAKIHISMLLPTRLRRLNHHVECFNRAILDMSYQYKNIRIIDNSMFGSFLSDEHVGVLYRPPSGSDNDSLNEFEKLVKKLPDKNVLLLDSARTLLSEDSGRLLLIRHRFCPSRPSQIGPAADPIRSSINSWTAAKFCPLTRLKVKFCESAEQLINMATAYIDPILPWLAIQNQNHSYGRKSRPNSAQRFVRIWNQPSFSCSRNSVTIPSFYKGSMDPSLTGVDTKIRLNPLGGRPRSAASSSSAARRRLVPAVVGFDEDGVLPPSPEEVWQRGFEQAHNRRGDDNGSDTSYVNFVRSYHGSSSRSSLTNNGKPQQAWEDTSPSNKLKGNVKVPYQTGSSNNSNRRDSREENLNYQISAKVLRGDVPPAEVDKSETLEDQDQTIIKPVTDLGDVDGGEGVVTPEDQLGILYLFDRSTQTGKHGSVSLERSYETAAADRSQISTCDKGVQFIAPRLTKPSPSSSDFFQKDNREEALNNKSQVQNKLGKKQRKTSVITSVDIAQPKFKEIPDFNMANWVQSRILVSAQSARYELPMDMHVLSRLSPLEYLTEYAIICKRRQALYKLIFSKYDRERKHFLKRKQAIAGLKEIHLGSASDLEITSILKMINLDDNFKIDFRFFCSIAAFSERVLARWMILPGGALTQKETIEKADFTNLTWKLEGVNITSSMEKVLYAL
ncbi:hypothetical protein ACHWQZ_G005061 [Mnemiopsis leidyi]